MRKHIANSITGCRIVFSMILLLLPPLSAAFYRIYLLCGFSDMIDGTIARRLHTESTVGSMLDSIADCAFVAAAGFSVLSAVYVPVWLWIWIGIITFLKAVNLITSLLKFRRLIPVHTVMNKITGGLLFLLPFGIGRGAWQQEAAAIVVTGIIATFAAVQEGCYIRAGREIQ